MPSMVHMHVSYPMYCNIHIQIRHRGVPANVLKALEEELADVSRKDVEKKPAGAPDGVKKGSSQERVEDLLEKVRAAKTSWNTE